MRKNPVLLSDTDILAIRDRNRDTGELISVLCASAGITESTYYRRIKTAEQKVVQQQQKQAAAQNVHDMVKAIKGQLQQLEKALKAA